MTIFFSKVSTECLKKSNYDKNQGLCRVVSNDKELYIFI